MQCDLHMHSIYSDGSDTPGELVALAKRHDLIIALTDHNTVSGVAEFLREAEENGVTAIGGTELSCAHGDDEFHLLGLFIAPEQYDRVERLAKEFHVLKEISNIEMVERLNAAGYLVNYSDIKRRNASGNANRAHVALELLEKGYVKSIDEAFKTLLSDDGGFYVQSERLKLVDAIVFLREIKALPILAHPLKDTTAEHLVEMLPQLIEAGLVGIETMHSSYSNEQIATAREIAARFGLLEGGGSDYHGKAKPDVAIGVGKGNVKVGVEVYENLLEKHKELYGASE